LLRVRGKQRWIKRQDNAFSQPTCPNAIKPLLPKTETCENAKAVMHIASRITYYFIELMWLATSLQGQLMNCRLFEGGLSV
jgi:hypothetical protein